MPSWPSASASRPTVRSNGWLSRRVHDGRVADYRGARVIRGAVLPLPFVDYCSILAVVNLLHPTHAPGEAVQSSEVADGVVQMQLLVGTNHDSHARTPGAVPVQLREVV